MKTGKAIPAYKRRSLGFVAMVVSTYLLTGAILSARDQSESRKDDERNRYIFNLSADPVGFLTLGPSIEVEFALARFLGVSAGARIPSLGFLTKSLYPTMKSAWTANCGLKFYLSKDQFAKGFYLGPRIEYGRTYYTTSSFQVLSVGLQVGYKWMTKSRLSFDLSDSIGPVLSSNTKGWGLEMIVFYLLSTRFGLAL